MNPSRERRVRAAEARNRYQLNMGIRGAFELGGRTLIGDIRGRSIWD